MSKIELVEVTNEIYAASKRLEAGSKELFKLAKVKAEKERDYRQALAKKILELREEKLQATLIPDVARGNCAELKFDRDLAESVYISGRDSLEAIKQQVSALQSILKYQTEVEG